MPKEHGHWSEPRPGKRVALFDVRMTKRTIDQHGQTWLVPEIMLKVWWTSLELDEETIIALYADHATSERFHSELKIDLDIRRRPSGKFATNALVLACA